VSLLHSVSGKSFTGILRLDCIYPLNPWCIFLGSVIVPRLLKNFWPFMYPKISPPYPQELTTGPSLLPDKFKHKSSSNSTINLCVIFCQNICTMQPKLLTFVYQITILRLFAWCPLTWRIPTPYLPHKSQMYLHTTSVNMLCVTQLWRW